MLDVLLLNPVDWGLAYLDASPIFVHNKAQPQSKEEEEEFITISNWRGKHNSLSRGAGADPPLASKRRPLPIELPLYDEHYAPTLP